MKTLKESLFDKDLVNKEVNFSSFWELKSIRGIVAASGRGRGKLPNKTTAMAAYDVANKFVLSKLKEKANSADLNDVMAVDNVIKASGREETISYIVDMINKLPVESIEGDSGESLLADLFSSVIKNNAKVKFDTRRYNNRTLVTIRIPSSSPVGWLGIELSYTER